MNKKVRNATPLEFNGIKFKSLLEVTTYKTLIDNELESYYEQQTFLIKDGITPKVPFYTKNKFKKKDFRIEVLSHNTVKDNRPLQGITYTPDFIVYYKEKIIVIECKGVPNEVYPYKMKLFRSMLEKLPDSTKYEIWEIFTKKQLLELIERLKQETNET